MRIELPEFSLILLVGPGSAGKTTFARKHFLPTQILSSDLFRGMVCDDENEQSVTKDAFELLHHAVEKRLEHRRTTVIDATNLQRSDRQKMIALAKAQNVHAAVVVLNLPESVLRERNLTRKDRRLPEAVLKSQLTALRFCMRKFKKEGFRFVYVLDSEEEIENAEIVYTKLWSDKKEEHGPFDIIGDVHGCFDELTELLDKLGYEPGEDTIYRHACGRRAVFVGDLCDRGPKNMEVLRLVMGMVRGGTAFCVPGNHDDKLRRYLNHGKVQISHGLENTIRELECEKEGFLEEVRTFLENLVSHYIFDGGRLVVSHAGIREEYIGRVSGKIRAFCLYGDTTGETDDSGFPVRRNWAADYRGEATIVYGHTPWKEVQAVNRTYCVDTGCVFGGKLTCIRYPEMEVVSAVAHRQYYERSRPLWGSEKEDAGLLDIRDVQGKLHLSTRLLPGITIPEENTASALEVMSRFAADPHWLIYLPPTMSPCRSSSMEDYMEHPWEAFQYYQKNGVERVICERKHMGSRAVIVLCRTDDTAKRRFGVGDGGRGIIYTRTGRRFFEETGMEAEILERLDQMLTENGFWEDFQTEWVCLDTEIMPWSGKAKALLKSQYGPVGRAGRESLSAAVEVLELAAGSLDIEASLERELRSLRQHFAEKLTASEAYVKAYRRYCWNVDSTEDLRIAPFHLLACEGRVFSREKHVWHMETLKRYCTGRDPIFIETEYLKVDLSRREEMEKAARWWESLTENGGEGMVVKPETFTACKGDRLIQPAVKCRGRDYLRIIYGPEYLMPKHLIRLKQRSLSRKRSLALKEFSLGLEALERFAAKEPLYRVHECVFAVLALESEPVDAAL
ncbi:MAG: polynucleotide kinase-phosphatase [Ruminococcus sp.]|nr:polynucleotide kinase-phosphatase [Ruminococcus sp.]